MKVHNKTVTTKKGNKMTKHYIRGNTIWINYYVEGKRYQKSTKLKNTPQNIKIVTSKIIPSLDMKIATGEIFKKKPKTFEYYGSIYLKQKGSDRNYEQMKAVYNRLLPNFESRNIDEISRLDIKEYLLSLDFNSKNPYKVVLKNIFEFAVDDEVLQTNPALNIKLPSVPKRKVEHFTKDEVKKILDVVPEGLLRTYLLIAFNTGLRAGEILGLQLGDFEDGYIHIKRSRSAGKVGDGKNIFAKRRVPFPSFILDEVKKIQTNHIFIFKDIDGSEKFRYMWNKYLEDAGVKKLRLYCTRHTYATLMLQDRVVSVNELAGLLGHSSVKTTLDKYASVISPDAIDLGKNFSLFDENSEPKQEKIK